MNELKDNFEGGLDKDSSFYKIAKNGYVDALNITRVSDESNNDYAVQNIKGNRLVNYNFQPGGNPVVIGVKNFDVRDTVLYFVWHPANYHCVLEYNNTTRTIAKVFENLTDSAGIDVLGFTANNKITSVNFVITDVGDLMYFLDSLDRPTKMNITRFKLGQYTPVSRDLLDVAMRPPLLAPVAVFANDTTVRSNGFRKRLLRFKYRDIYDDYEKSTFSPISSIPIPANPLDDAFNSIVTNNNRVNVNVIKGNKATKKIELAVSIAEKGVWSDFLSVKVIDVSAYNEGDSVPFAFYNDGTYPTVDISESLLPYDFVPDKAKAQEAVNGNVLVYGNITEGYDRSLSANVQISINTIAAGTGIPTGNLNAVPTIISNTAQQQIFSILFSGAPIQGTVVTVRVRQVNTGTVYVAGIYTTQPGDTSNTVAAGVGAALVLGGQVYQVFASGSAVIVTANQAIVQPKREFVSVIIDPPIYAGGVFSVPTFTFSTNRRLGLVYFDQKGKTNGVIYSTGITMPAYSENISEQVLLPYINAKIFHTPPDWAHSYQWVLTKENTQYIYWYTPVVYGDNNFLYFGVSNFDTNTAKYPTTSEVLSYSFQEGDRLRLIKRDADNFVFNDTYDGRIEGLVVDPVINGGQIPGKYIKIQKLAPFTTVNFASNNFVIQLYRPAQQNAGGDNQNEVFYEFAQGFPIINPTLSTRYHGGNVTNQDITGGIPAESNFYNGDSYFRQRSIPISEAGTAAFSVQDRNFADFFLSAVNDIDGRPSLIDENAKKATYETLVRFGQAYQPNTNINGLNRFFPNNYDNYDASFGGIMRLKSRDRYMRVFQKLKIGTVPIFNQISKNADGTQLLVVTDRLLNPIQYYAGNYGIGTASESLASLNFADYFCDNLQGVICRVSNDGIQPISILYRMNSFAQRELVQRTGNAKIYGVAEPSKEGNYIIALEAVTGSPAVTLVFREDSNTFETFASFLPEMMVSLNDSLIVFKNGQVWTHDNPVYNNFFGQQYDSYITVVFNLGGSAKKQPMSLSEVADSVWECPDIETSTNSYGATKQASNLTTADFREYEGMFSAAFLRDINSVGGIINGQVLKGEYVKVKFKISNTTDLVRLNSVLLKWNNSANNVH